MPRVGSTHHVAAPGGECALGGAREGFRQLSSSCPLELSEEDPSGVPLGRRSTESLGSCNSLPRASVPLPFKDPQASLTPGERHHPCSAEQPLLAKKLNPLPPPGSVLRSSKSPRPPHSEGILWGHPKEAVSGWGQSRPGGSSWEPPLFRLKDCGSLFMVGTDQSSLVHFLLFGFHLSKGAKEQQMPG